MTSPTVRAWAMLVAVGALVAPTTVWATSQQDQALPSLRMSKIQYDPPGADVLTNTQINKEWVQIHNYGTKPRDLTGWVLRDVTGFRFKFPAGFVVEPGITVTIHTGKGTNKTQHLFWRQGAYIWNNTGDKATLKNSAGTVIDTCAYSGAGQWVSC